MFRSRGFSYIKQVIQLLFLVVSATLAKGRKANPSATLSYPFHEPYLQSIPI
jgi:hypothetical protein